MRLLVFSCFLLVSIPSILLHPYIGVLLYSWISFMSPHRLIWSFPSTIPLALITAVMTLVAWFFSNEPKRLPFNLSVGLFITFAAYCTFTTIIALNPEPAYVEYDRTIKELLFVLVTIVLTTNRIRLHALVWVMAIAIGYFGLKGGVFSLMHGGVHHIYGPPDTAIADNNDLGAGLSVALPLINYVRMNSANRWVRLGLSIIMVSSVVAIVGTYSRAAFLGLLAVSAFAWLRSRGKVIAGVIMSLVIVAVVAFMPATYLDRLSTIQNYEEDSSATGRIEIWGAALKITIARPLTGAGFKATESQAVVDRFDPGIEARAVHNVYLQVLAHHGFVGFAIWSAMLLVGWRNSSWVMRASRDQPQWRWAGDFARMAQISLVAYCVVGSFGNYAYWDYYFTIVGLLAATRTMLERARVLQATPAVASAVSRGGPRPASAQPQQRSVQIVGKQPISDG